jgi:hypothetical protein
MGSLLTETQWENSGWQWSLPMARQRADSEGVFSRWYSEHLADSEGVSSRWYSKRPVDGEGTISWWDSERIARDSWAHKPQSVWWSGEVSSECSTAEWRWNCIVRCEWGTGFEQRQGQEPKELDVQEQTYLLRVILKVLLKCSVFITALIIVSVVSMNIVIC